MSKKDNLSDFLWDLLQGIRTKNPNASSNPQDFRAAIEAIETGGGGGIVLDPLANPATAAQILEGKQLYNSDGSIVTGTMKSIGALNYSIDGINSTSLTIPSGYTSGGTISLTDDIQNEVDTQEDLIRTISIILESKAAGLAEITVTDLRYSA